MVQITKDIIFGIHSATLLDRDNGFIPLNGGFLEILGDQQFNFAVENVPLNGGSAMFPFAAENGAATSEIAMTVKQYSEAMWDKFAGAILTSTASSATGTVGSLRNTKGTSASDATTGIAGIAALSGSEANLKAGTYFVEVTGAATVTIKCSTNIDFNEGTDVDFETQDLEVVASDVTVPGSGATVNSSALGLQITGGSGTVAMTAGDVAVFEVAPAHGGIQDYSVGSGDLPQYVGIEFWAQKQSDDTKWRIRFPKVKLNGLPINLTEKGWSEAELTGTPVIDVDPVTGEEGLYNIRQIRTTQ